MADPALILTCGHQGVATGERRAHLRVVTLGGMPHSAVLKPEQIPAPAQALSPPTG